MPRQFQRGHKAKVSDLTPGTDLYVGVQIAGPGLTFDISCFGLDADERLSDDRYFVFFNQPKTPEESVQLLGAQAGDTESFRVTLDRVPASIHKLSFTATVDGAGQMSQVGPGYIRIVAGGEEVVRYAFTGAEFSTERAVMLGDFYRKDVWRFAAVGQGFDGGLDALLKNFGGEVAEEQEAPQPPAGQAPGFAPPAFAAPAAPQAPQPQQAPQVPPPAPQPPQPPQSAEPFAAPTAAPQPPPPPQPYAAEGAPPIHAAPTVAAMPGAAPAPYGDTAPPPPAPPPPAPPPPAPGAPTPPPYGQVPGQAPGPGQPFGAPPAPYGQPAPGQAPFGAPPQPMGNPFGGPPQGGGAVQGFVPQGAPPGGAGLHAALNLYKEVPTGQRWTAQNGHLMRVDLTMAGGAPVLARQGSMVMYQGKVDFGYKGAGFAGRIVGNATGQEMQLMRCTGRGQVFLADNNAHLHQVELQGDGICVSAENVLAFDESLSYEVRRIDGHGIPGGALFTMLFQGTGTVVVKTHGTPVVLPVTPTTFADCNAVVAWSAAAQVILSSQVRLRRNAYPGHSGETVNLQFRGAPGNFIVVQPYEV